MNQVAMVIQKFRPAFSGQGVQVEDLCRQLAGRAVQTRIFTATRGHPSSTEECDGYSVRRLRADLLPGSARRNALWMPTFAFRVRRELMAMGDELSLIHVHAQTDALYAAWSVARARRVPLILEMTLLGDDDPVTMLARRQRFRGWRERIYRDCDAYVAMSRAFVPAYRQVGLPDGRLHVIPQGVDTGRFRPAADHEREAVRRELGVRLDAPVVLFVGSLIERKGIDVLLAAWARVVARIPEARLWLAGRDDFEARSREREFLESELGRLGEDVRASICTLGERSDVERLLHGADVFAFPSRREGFGTVIVEAMAAGVPAIVAELPGISDFIFRKPPDATSLSADADGVIVAQESADDLATAIEGLTAGPAIAAAIGAAGRARAVERFDFARITTDYLRLYRETIAEKASL